MGSVMALTGFGLFRLYNRFIVLYYYIFLFFLFTYIFHPDGNDSH